MKATDPIPCSANPGANRTGEAETFYEDVMSIQMNEVLQRLAEIQTSLVVLAGQRPVKDWFTTAEAARSLGRAEFTVREWCRRGRVHAEKKGSGRGRHQPWVISREELQRIEREGLLPAQRS
jgi:hypothetical protein